MQTEEISPVTRTDRRVDKFARRGVMVVLCVGAFVAGTVIGNGGAVHAADEDAKATVLVKERVAPPVVRIEKGSVAIIGASDDRYYLVQPDGRTAILTGLNREDLCWRRSDER